MAIVCTLTRITIHRGCQAVRVTAVATLLATMVLSAPARADFEPPFWVSEAGPAGSPQLAIDGAGNALFTWVHSDGTNNRIETRIRSAAGVLGPIQTLSKAGQDASDPRVAVNAAGDAAFTWVRSDGTNNRIQARTRSAVGARGSIQTLSEAGQDASNPEVAMDGADNAVFAWVRSDGTNRRIEARTLSAAGVLGPVLTLSEAGHDAFDSELAVDAAGVVVFTWARTDDRRGRSHIEARTLSTDGVLGSIQILSDVVRRYRATDTRVAVDPIGDAVVTWLQRYQKWCCPGKGWILARTRTAAGVLGPIQTISFGSFGRHREVSDPQVAVDTNGDAVFTWFQARSRIEARTLSAAGVLGPILNVSKTKFDIQVGAPQVAVEGDGDAVLTWMEREGNETSRIQARTLFAAGVLGPIQTISTKGYDASSPQVEVRANSGAAVVVWSEWDGINWRIRAAAGP